MTDQNPSRVPATPHETQPRIAIECDYDRRVNFAVQQNAVPVVKRLSISNAGETELVDVNVRVGIDRDLSRPWNARLDRLAPGATFNFENVDVPLDGATLLRTTERERATLEIEVRSAGVPAVTERLPIDVLAWNEWGGLGSLPELLTAFILPNNDAVAGLLAKTRDRLEARGAGGSLSGYVDASPTRVREVVRALYEAARTLRIGYATTSASFEREGQKVRSPDQIVAHRLANCLDLVLFLAAGVEQAGLRPLILLAEDHATLGVWLREESLPEPTVDDAVRLAKRVELAELTVVEATGVTNDPSLDFDAAEAAGRRHLADRARFVCAIDVHAARRQRVRPLPLRRPEATTAADLIPPISPAAAPASPAMDGEVAPDSVPQEQTVAEAAAETPQSRLDRWKRRLLDLTLRNRLLNHRESKRTIPLDVPDLAALEDHLADGHAFTISPRAKMMSDADPRSADVHRARTGEDALRAYLTDELGERRLHATIAATELERRLVEVYRSARRELEETGANTLFLALGFLVWNEPDTGTERRAPLLLLPLTLDRKTARSGFTIHLGEDEPRINVTLIEKLATDFGLDVRGHAELPEDERGVDVDVVLRRFRESVLDLPEWRVEETATIGLFSFAKFLMWRDLEERSATLLENDVVKHLVGRPDRPFAEDFRFPALDELDATRPAGETLCPLDADSSQLGAVFAAADGGSFVLEGPPGTGKSQTITNLIAHALGRGQRVLFVAEKMAALSVVHRRLTAAGLGPFVLELHSNQARKLEVLSQLAEPLEAPVAREPARWDDDGARLDQLRGDLNAYVCALHANRDFGASYFDITEHLLGMHETPKVPLEIDGAQAIGADRLDELRDAVEGMGSSAAAIAPIASHPLRGVRRESWETSLAERVEKSCGASKRAAAALASVLDDPAAAIGLRSASGSVAAALSREQLTWLDELGRHLRDTPGPERPLLVDPGWRDLAAELAELIRRGRAYDRARAELLERYRPELFDVDHGALLARLRGAVGRFFLIAWFRARPVRKALAAVSRSGSLADDATLITQLEAALANVAEGRELAASESARRSFGALWRPDDADWERLEKILGWADSLRSRLMAAPFAADHVTFTPDEVIELATALRDRLAPGAPVATSLERASAARDELEARLGETIALLQLEVELAFGPDAEHGYLPRVEAALSAISSHRDALDDWCQYQRARRRALPDLGALVAELEAGRISADEVDDVFERSILELLHDATTDGEELLRHFNGREQRRLIDLFRERDRSHLGATRDRVRASLGRSVPSAPGKVAETSETGILKRQLQLKRRHMPLRKLFERIPNLLARLKPCLLMSPLSVAQYLDASHPPFDLVVFDEASQIPVWDAIGPIARGRAVVIVGDSKQLPPTTFFQRQGDDDEALETDDFEEMESILDECLAAGLPSMRLLWHYRSRDESLITFSNWRYYDNRLVTFPSTQRAGDLGVSLVHVAEGRYDKGGTRTNAGEARALVAEVVRRLLATKTTDSYRSIGVVTFSQPQQVLIEDLLDEARREHPEIEPFFAADREEPVFVKNLENVQGDERSIILFSICYGPDESGRVSMNFGPLNRSGGERRLNVAVTRARERVLVFSSLRGDQIDLSRTQSLGVRDLRAFLDYAERGVGAFAEATTLPGRAESGAGLEEDIARRLEARGYDVARRVGSSHIRIDLAIRDAENPACFRLGILTDGPFYRAAANARDRERLRDEVLARLGWRLVRVFAVDWLRNPDRELERIEVALTASEDVVEPPGPETDDVAEAEPDEGEPGAAVYRPCRRSDLEPIAGDFVAPDSLGLIQRAIERVIEIEAPLTLETLVRRLAGLWEIGRITPKVREQVGVALQRLPAPRRPTEIGGVFWRGAEEAATWDRFRVPEPEDAETVRNPEDLPAAEVAAAAGAVLAAQIGLPREDLVRETARVLGFARTGKNVNAAMEAGIALLESRGGCTSEEDRVRLNV